MKKIFLTAMSVVAAGMLTIVALEHFINYAPSTEILENAPVKVRR